MAFHHAATSVTAYEVLWSMSATNDDPTTIAPEIASQKGNRPLRFRLRGLMIAVSILGVLLAIVVSAYRSAREETQRHNCDNNLKQIGLALLNYHDTFQSFPAAWQVDGSGKIAHSWRVAILPFIEANADFNHYSHSEPWNGPNNSKIATRRGLRLYACPGDRNHKPAMTSYVAVVGRSTMWPVSGYMRTADLVDSASTTIMVVEITNSDIHWMEPRDLPVEELMVWLKPGHKPALFSSHTRGRIRGGIVVFADGHTEFLPHDIIEKRLRALLSPAGNDVADGAAEPETK